MPSMISFSIEGQKGGVKRDGFRVFSLYDTYTRGGGRLTYSQS